MLYLVVVHDFGLWNIIRDLLNPISLCSFMLANDSIFFFNYFIMISTSFLCFGGKYHFPRFAYANWHLKCCDGLDDNMGHCHIRFCICVRIKSNVIVFSVLGLCHCDSNSRARDCRVLSVAW